MKKYLHAIAIWVLIVPLAIINGILRDQVYDGLGDAARPISGIILSVLILIVAFIFIPRIKDCTPKDYLGFGVLWFILTNLFDLSAILADGTGFADYLEAFNVAAGNLWIIVVITALVAPPIAGRVRGRRSAETTTA